MSKRELVLAKWIEEAIFERLVMAMDDTEFDCYLRSVHPLP